MSSVHRGRFCLKVHYDCNGKLLQDDVRDYMDIFSNRLPSKQGP